MTWLIKIKVFKKPSFIFCDVNYRSVAKIVNIHFWSNNLVKLTPIRPVVWGISNKAWTLNYSLTFPKKVTSSMIGNACTCIHKFLVKALRCVWHIEGKIIQPVFLYLSIRLLCLFMAGSVVYQQFWSALATLNVECLFYTAMPTPLEILVPSGGEIQNYIYLRVAVNKCLMAKNILKHKSFISEKRWDSIDNLVYHFLCMLFVCIPCLVYNIEVY